MDIRPHHALCLAFFRGKGYSEDFVKNMEKVKAALEAGEQVFLVTGKDAICAACPNWQGDKCETEEKVCRYDRGVLDRCALEPGQTLSFQALEAAAQEHILRPGLREKVCGDCQWTEICR